MAYRFNDPSKPVKAAGVDNLTPSIFLYSFLCIFNHNNFTFTFEILF